MAYSIGRIGCFLAGDGTYGKPSDPPWAMDFPNGTMPTLVPVHPTALYESVFAIVLAGLLWSVRMRMAPVAVFGLYAVLSGVARLLVEEVRINKPVLLGMTQPQLWSLLWVAAGAALLIRARRRVPSDPVGPGAGETEPGAVSGTGSSGRGLGPVPAGQ